MEKKTNLKLTVYLSARTCQLVLTKHQEILLFAHREVILNAAKEGSENSESFIRNINVFFLFEKCCFNVRLSVRVLLYNKCYCDIM